MLIAVGGALLTLIALTAAWIGIGIYKIDHAVHHVVVPASLLAKGKNDLLAIVKGPNHFEQVFVFHDTGAHTNVLKVPSSLALPLSGGHSATIEDLNLHKPDAIIAGLDQLGIPVTHYVGVDLHMVEPEFEPREAGHGQALGLVPHLGSNGHHHTARAGCIAHLPGTQHAGVGRPLTDERPHCAPRFGPDLQGRTRHGRPRLGVSHGSAQFPLMPGHARPRAGALVRWRAWLHGLAKSPASDKPEQSPPQVVPRDGEQRVTDTSLDDVLRNAAPRRDSGDDPDAGKSDPTGS